MTRLFADSTIDLTPEECQQMGITTVPLTIHFGEQSYRDGVDMTHKEFYRRLRAADTLPTTSQVNPAQFEDAFAPYLQNGDDIVIITISGKLSATNQSAQLVADANPGRVHVVDSSMASFGAQLLIHEAVRLRDEGKKSAAQIADALRAIVPRMRLYAVLDTLKYLRMGGRLSGGAALLGGILGILPVVEVRDGVVTSVAKVRGDRAGMQTLLDFLEKMPPDPAYGICFGHADDEARLEKYLTFLRPHLHGLQIHTSSLGSVIGTHTGPGLVGIAYVLAEQ